MILLAGGTGHLGAPLSEVLPARGSHVLALSRDPAPARGRAPGAAELLMKGRTATVFGRGENPITFVSVRDVARLIELAVTDGRVRGRTLDIGGPENLTLNAMVEVIAASSGRAPRARHVPMTALRLGAALMRPFQPDVAGLMVAAIRMDTADITLDVAAVAVRYPGIPVLRPVRA